MKRKNIIIISIIILIFIVGIAIFIKLKKQENAKKTLKQIAEFYGCEFVKETNTTEGGYSKKIYWNYDVPPVNPLNNISYKDHYEEVLKAVSGQIKNNFILKDEKNSLEIRVKYNSKNNKIIYIINNDINYFQSEENKQIAKLNNNEDKITHLNIKSKELIDTIANNWSRKKTESSYGNKIKLEDNYDIYSNGIKIKTINSKIYNLVFSKEYQGNVFENITTGMENENIRKILGNSTYENEQDNLLIGYKTDKYYVFFSNGQVSIYPFENIDEEKNKQFANVVQEYNKDQSNYNEILKEITSIYPDYTEFVQDENGIDLKYPLKGLEIKMGNHEKSGIYIYNNYKGYIITDKTKKDLENNNIDNIYLINKNFIFEEELKRTMKEQN